MEIYSRKDIDVYLKMIIFFRNYDILSYVFMQYILVNIYAEPIKYEYGLNFLRKWTQTYIKFMCF